MANVSVAKTRSSFWVTLNQWWSAGMFLGPSLLGLLVFTIVPLLISLAMAFTNWDLRLHNSFRNERLRFVGFQNFLHLLNEPELWRYLGNTLYLMLGIPFAMAGSLGLAVVISGDLRGRKPKTWRLLIVLVVILASCTTAAALAFGNTMSLLMCGIFSIIVTGGVAGGSVVYRTLCYLPSFTSGVAVYLLWKKLYSPASGPINVALQRPLLELQRAIEVLPWSVQIGSILILVVSQWLLFLASRRLRMAWQDAECDTRKSLLTLLLLVIPSVIAWRWLNGWSSLCLLLSTALIVGRQFYRIERRETGYRRGDGGGAISLGVLAMVAQLVCVGLAAVLWMLPHQVAVDGGLHPPAWLASVTWAKPAIMITSFWGAIGSNNMLLYLAGLSSISPELYEAADIDGASRWQRFWHISWPQLAPTTLFIAIISIIAGLQGGFEMAQAMTRGGPAGSTTTLSYFIYIEGFQTGRLGYSSAVAWFLFAIVLIVTLVGWKFGSEHAEN